ncbi:hypothetical protein [Streptomyces sp. NBC_00474]|uniref:hypothetical protein n=1 Tax=Streptomyces sp. NBC_00474 TaxID=2975754 RepID=UPI002253FBC3|nr:hypothetical protein [Streptomyces sp. NBC_00474]MCX5051049.1 hypothetical protein [Streptomyces sp. NBC_00474]
MTDTGIGSHFPVLRPKKEISKKAYTIFLLVSIIAAVVAFILAGMLHPHDSGPSLVFTSVGASLVAGIIFGSADIFLSRRASDAYMEEVGTSMITALETFSQGVGDEISGLNIATSENLETFKSAVKRELEDLKLQSNPLAAADRVGLVQVFPSEMDDPCREVREKVIRTSPRLIMAINLESSWIGDHINAIWERLKDPQKEKNTMILLLTGGNRTKEIEVKKLEIFRMLELYRPKVRRREYRFLANRYYSASQILVGMGDALVCPHYMTPVPYRRIGFWYRETHQPDGYYRRLLEDLQLLARDAVDLVPWCEQRMRDMEVARRLGQSAGG